ncbi:MAG: FxsA family protein [Planctomycetota bacterium]|nr:MAG: FxsA family protein [Planctomycetota bacterium]REJ98763.1 MAG: FxsA family protein [Planctomycetota bacterium]REK28009.1 MAG: FxsA family protein [Planctomycetota bacterium]REK47190.1 MAG: FxsA family protein [Planctomycetota bacterium]
MLGRLLLLFILVPLAELYLLFKLAEFTSTELAFGLVIITGIVGASLARWQGMRTWQRIQTELAQGRPPAIPLIHGMCILVAGALLLTPGMMTDAVGFALLIPPVRTWLAKRYLRRVATQFQQRPGGFEWSFTAPSPPPRDEVIETRILEADEDKELREVESPRHGRF